MNIYICITEPTSNSLTIRHIHAYIVKSRDFINKTQRHKHVETLTPNQTQHPTQDTQTHTHQVASKAYKRVRQTVYCNKHNK